MSDLSIQLRWQRAEPELQPGRFSNAHTVQLGEHHDLRVDAAPDWGGAPSAATLATGKRAFYRQREMPLSEAYDYASAVMVENLLAHDAEEGIGAFLGKRPSRWQNR